MSLYREKYLKYKKKYLELKQHGGIFYNDVIIYFPDINCEKISITRYFPNIPDFLNINKYSQEQFKKLIEYAKQFNEHKTLIKLKNQYLDGKITVRQKQETIQNIQKYIIKYNNHIDEIIRKYQKEQEQKIMETENFKKIQEIIGQSNNNFKKLVENLEKNKINFITQEFSYMKNQIHENSDENLKLELYRQLKQKNISNYNGFALFVFRKLGRDDTIQQFFPKCVYN